VRILDTGQDKLEMTGPTSISACGAAVFLPRVPDGSD
jgi:hypothetical protein